MSSIVNNILSSKATPYIATAIGAVVVNKIVSEIYKKYRPQPEVPFPHVPTTISPKAQEYLRTAIPVGGPVKSTEVWSMIRGFFREATNPTSEKAKAEYTEETKRTSIGGVSVLEVTPKGYKAPSGGTRAMRIKEEPVLVYMHGGAFTLGSPEHLYQIFAPVAHKSGMKTYAIDYRLAPENPHPAGLDDCVSVCKELLNKHKNVYFLGDSAGGNLCIATVFKLREEGLNLPKAVGLFSPVVDLEKNSDSLHTLKGVSPKLDYEKSLVPSYDAYVRKEQRKDPLVSVINGDFKGFPPVSIHTGSRDALQSGAYRLDRKLKNSGVHSSLEVWDGLWHGFQEHDIPEAKESTTFMGKFFTRKHGRNR